MRAQTSARARTPAGERTPASDRPQLAARFFQCTAVELSGDVKPALLREYLRRWKFEVGMFFDGVGPDASDEKLLQIAPGCPVFQITTRPE